MGSVHRNKLLELVDNEVVTSMCIKNKYIGVRVRKIICFNTMHYTLIQNGFHGDAQSNNGTDH